MRLSHWEVIWAANAQGRNTKTSSLWTIKILHYYYFWLAIKPLNLKILTRARCLGPLVKAWLSPGLSEEVTLCLQHCWFLGGEFLWTVKPAVGKAPQSVSRTTSASDFHLLNLHCFLFVTWKWVAMEMIASGTEDLLKGGKKKGFIYKEWARKETHLNSSV